MFCVCISVCVCVEEIYRKVETDIWVWCEIVGWSLLHLFHGLSLSPTLCATQPSWVFIYSTYQSSPHISLYNTHPASRRTLPTPYRTRNGLLSIPSLPLTFPPTFSSVCPRRVVKRPGRSSCCSPARWGCVCVCACACVRIA